MYVKPSLRSRPSVALPPTISWGGVYALYAPVPTPEKYDGLDGPACDPKGGGERKGLPRPFVLPALVLDMPELALEFGLILGLRIGDIVGDADADDADDVDNGSSSGRKVNKRFGGGGGTEVRSGRGGVIGGEGVCVSACDDPADESY